jgi:hypothetical protein
MSGWSADERRSVAEWRRQNWSFSKIGAALGLTRSAVAGRIDRDPDLSAISSQSAKQQINGERKPSKPKNQKAEKPHAEHQPEPHHHLGTVNAGALSLRINAIMKAIPIVPLPPPPALPPDPANFKVLTELTSRTCKFPVGEDHTLVGHFLFCCSPVIHEGAPYCRYHTRICTPTSPYLHGARA